MTRKTIRSILTFIALAVGSAVVAFAQSISSVEIPVATAHDSWQAVELTASPKGRIIVVTADQPRRRLSCHVQSFDKGKLVCSRAIGGPRTFLPQQVVALILPGDGGLRLPMFLGFNAGLGAAIWGTVVLAAACPVCAVGTGIAALFCFGGAGAVAYADGQPDRLLYLAPGQELSDKLGDVER